MKNRAIRKDVRWITCIAAVVVMVMSFAPMSSAVDRDDGMIPIVMTHDPLCFVNGEVDTVRVQRMVDSTVVELTGIIGDMPLAYQCLFPMVDTSTKILIKYNPNAPQTTVMPMMRALKRGLSSMLEGKFPEDNITIIGEDYDSRASDTITIDSLVKYTIKEVYTNCDYIISCPSARISDFGSGLDMCFTLMLTSIEGVGSTTIEDMYPFIMDTVTPALSVLNFHPTFNGDSSKVCLYMLDLLSYQIPGNDDSLGAGNRIYATRNITVCEWKGMRFLSDSVGVLDSLHTYQSQKVCSLSVEPIDLGVVNEAQMNEIHVDYATPVKQLKNGNLSVDNIQINAFPGLTLFTYPKETDAQAVFTVYDIHGRKIWSKTTSERYIVWNNKNLNGRKISSGVYLYQLRLGESAACGKATIR